MMKKLLKVTSLLAVVLMLLLALTGCGGNKLVGTMEEDNYKSKIEISFDKNDKLSKMVITNTYNSSSDAKDAYEELKDDSEGAKVKRSGKKVTITMKAKDFSEEFGADEDELDKDTMEQFVKYMGYELKD
ncbi:MAG: hypothetical protein IJH12_04060 [Clostridia bacterium]|nr:hypothetical protein [Clostridia bacterium]